MTLLMAAKISSSLLVIGRNFSTELTSFLMTAPIFSIRAVSRTMPRTAPVMAPTICTTVEMVSAQVDAANARSSRQDPPSPPRLPR
ncbi:hypothetical protein [Amycolatopsis rhizosphaerae]|uniref:hypothetical protein n=1 Tax=Amycolatopsis rhizosphaerae TaxID=2053003 RepID=UPI001643B412|nr:hypothetical protein [Amycolatopsis rhizosphaerae]